MLRREQQRGAANTLERELGPATSAATNPSIVTVSISSLGSAGEGVGRVTAGPPDWVGRACFVPGALPGEQVQARVNGVRSRYLRAELVTLETSSPDRVEPSCPVYAECGGCQLQHLRYPAQLSWKRQMVVDALRHVGGIAQPPVAPCLPAADPWRYRNKVQMPVARAAESVHNRCGEAAAQPPGSRLSLGFYRRGTHQVVDVPTCPVQPELGNRMAARIRDLLAQERVLPYDERSRTGDLRHVLVRIGRRTGEALVVFVTRTPHWPVGPSLAERLSQEFPQLVGVVQNIQPGIGNVILGNEEKTLYGQPYLHEVLRVQVSPGRWVERRFQISARSFFQVNSAQAERLIELALASLPEESEGPVLDLYCGAGAFTLFLAARFSQVTGIEEVPAAVADARVNARLNDVTNVRFLVGQVERLLPGLPWMAAKPQRQLLPESAMKPGAVLVDPPRAGLAPAVVQALAQLGPGRIVYVSCNPATLARDLRGLLAPARVGATATATYRLERVQPVDMFPWTAHVESIATLVRQADR